VNERQRHDARTLAEFVTKARVGHPESDRGTLAVGLLAEHAEVLAGRVEIARLQDAVESVTRSGTDNAARYAEGLAAARGITERLRAAILAGATDAAQAEATAEALHVVEDHPPEWRTVTAARAFLACSEALREARAKYESDRAAAGVIVRICQGIRGDE
jgi:hypothetical protein